MGKIKPKPVFKQYEQKQMILLPLDLGEMISSDHLVRVINLAVDKMNLSPVIRTYSGGGASSYHPVMLTKVMLYAYSVKLYTGRKIARALRENIPFMWLAAGNRPDFRTLNGFRSGRLKETINELFKEMLLLLMEEGYIRFEDYFCDGSTWAADANPHKMVWRRNAERYKAAAEKKCEELFEQIDALNEEEDKQYADQDLEIEGGGQKNIYQKIEDKTEELNGIVEQTVDKKKKRKARTLHKQMKEQETSIRKYENQQVIAGTRGGYSVRDKDATGIRMKNKELAPGYNVLAGSENQFITGYSIHQNSNDAACFKEHLAILETQAPQRPVNITADSIFGTEENYRLLEEKNITSYLKYPAFHKEQSRKELRNPFLKEHFPYNEQSDSYTCPNGQILTHQTTECVVNKRTGYVATLKVYECKSCVDCPFALKCKKEEETNRRIKINYVLDKYKKNAASNLRSEKGLELRRQRRIDIEPCFGDIKHNMKFRRLHLIGKQKVTAEMGIVFIAHNFRKMHLKMASKNAKAA